MNEMSDVAKEFVHKELDDEKTGGFVVIVWKNGAAKITMSCSDIEMCHAEKIMAKHVNTKFFGNP